jgi:hypothetical protein
LANSSDFDIDEAVRLLRDNNMGDDLSRSDVLAALVNSYPSPKEGVQPIFKQLVRRVGDTLFAEDIKECNAAHRACIYHTQDTAALLFLWEMARQKSEILGQTTGEAHKKRTYLHLAAEKKWHRVFEWLLKAKVNVKMEQEDMDKKMACDVAFEENDGIVMSMFAMRHVARQIENATAKNVKVRRHWLRTSDNDEKLSELPKKGDGGDSPLKLFTISKNKVSPSRLASRTINR